MRAATFEVVVRKPENDPLSYEKPLPLELIPFTERNDPYWSVGSAFAIAKNTYVTAAHVVLQGLGSGSSSVAIRNSQGEVFPIDQITKFSAHEDFVVFTSEASPRAATLSTRRDAAIDEPVFAVGNALGEGVVIRDGLLTSMTPEAQDGRWKWLRFSAAASPGNSGGPLIDAEGKVIGVIIGKSTAENLNYALPIAHVVDAPNKARIDSRQVFKLPILLDTIVASYKAEFTLPVGFVEFASRVQDADLNFYREQKVKLLAAHADELFPRGDSAKLLATVPKSSPSLVLQQQDRSWDRESGSRKNTTKPTGGGEVWTAELANATLFRVVRPDGATDPAFYGDSRESMDLLLKGLKLSRVIGTESIRITSLGVAQRASEWRDRFQRPWWLRTWRLGHLNMDLIMAGLPTPDGVVGMLKVAPAGSVELALEELRLLTDYFSASYAGSFPQWRAFLPRKETRPAVFDGITIDYDYARGARYQSKRLRVDVPRGLMQLDDSSSLRLLLTFIPDHGVLTWDVSGLYVSQDKDEKTFVGILRQAKPAGGAGTDLETRWEDMSDGDGEFAGVRGHDEDWKKYWMRTATGARVPNGAVVDGASVLYELVSQTERVRTPREIDDMHEQLKDSVLVYER